MEGASRASPSPLLCALAPKTASGGKIRTSRFAPGLSARKSLYRFGKTYLRSRTRVGAPILANTVGNLVADGIAGRGSPKDDIVVNQDAIDRAMGNLPSSLPSTDIDLGLSPETRIALMEGSGEISSATASALRARVTEIKTELRADYLASAGSQVGGVATVDGLTAQPTGGTDLAISMFELNNWRAGAYDVYQGGYVENGVRKAYSASYYDDIVKGYDSNEALIHQWDAVANGEVNKILYYGAGLPAQLALETVTGELAIGAAVKGYRLWQAGRVAESATPVMRGIAFENSAAAAARSEAFLPGESVRRLSVRAFDDAGNLLPGRTVLDLAGNRGAGQLGALEFKLNEGVSLTARQSQHFPYLARNGGVVVGNNGRALGLRAGSPIGPLDVQRINGPTLPLTWWPK